jgi:predicted molibdopterin-dependent oxidoreductase YjgC
MGQNLTTCTFCGVGCGLYLETSGNRVVGAYPSTSHPANAGRICVRGWHVHEISSSPDRLKTPLLKKNGRFEPVTWEEALWFTAHRLREIRDAHGPDALAFLNSPRCSNEEAYLLQKLARTVIGTNNVDHGTGIYCNNSINVLLDMIGVPATTNSIAELGQSSVILVEGVDLVRRLPTVGGAVIRAKLNGAKLIVIGTRRHRVVEHADIFLQVKPGTETVLFGAMAKVIEDRGLMALPFIKARCRNYEAFRAQVREYDLLEAAERCGVEAGLIESAALAYAGAKAAALLYSSSMEDCSAERIQGMVNLVLLTGNLGKPGAGIFALAEQNNLQGVCDVGVLPDRLPGFGAVGDAAARAELEALWKARIPATPGLDARSVLANAGRGKVKGLWLARYSPAATAFLTNVAGSLRECDLIVFQHLFLTEAAQYAHVVLPTTAFGEERVTFTSTERRIQLADQAVQPPPGPKPAWEQLTQLARILGADWNYQSAEDVMREIGDAVPFYSGASYDNLAREYGRQWPCTKDRPLGTQFLFGASSQPRPFKFVPVPKPPPAPPAPEDLPFTLVFGNSLYYWNQNVLIRHSGILKREYRSVYLDYPQGFVEVNSDDAKRLGIRDGDRIQLRAAHAAAGATARVTPDVRQGTIFVPYFMHDVALQILGSAEFGSQLVPVRMEKEAS